MAPTRPILSSSSQSSSSNGASLAGPVGGAHCHRNDVLSCRDVSPTDGRSSLSTHTVIKGETVWSIARDYLGDAKLWQWLAVMNGLEPTVPIYAGMSLRLHPSVASWVPVVKTPSIDDSKNIGPVASWPATKGAENVCPAVIQFFMGQSSGKLDLDEGLQELFRPFEFEVGLGPFIARIRLKGSLKVKRTGVVSNGLTFSQLGLEMESSRIKDGIMKDISGTVKLRYQAFSKENQALNLKIGDKLTFDKAEFSFEYDFAENAAVFTASAKPFKYKSDFGEVEGKIGVEVRIKKRDKSLSGDGNDFVPVDEPYEASVAATAAVLIPVVVILGSGAAAVTEMEAVGTAYAFAARAVSVQLPKLIAIGAAVVKPSLQPIRN